MADEILQQGEYPPLPQPDTHCYDDERQVDVWSYSAEQMHAYLDAHLAARGAAQAAPAEDDKWRSLALQFDSHRMQALSHLKLLLECGEDHADAVRTFLAGPPLDGESVLAQRIAAYAQQPAPVAEDAEDAARFRAMVNAALNEDEGFARTMQAEKSEPTTLDEVRALVDKARAQAAQPEGGANGQQ